jgi:hypothetical protein
MLHGATYSTPENFDHRRMLTVGDICILLEIEIWNHQLLKYGIINYSIESFNPELHVGVLIFR